jgi:hypothetical protein
MGWVALEPHQLFGYGYTNVPEWLLMVQIVCLNTLRYGYCCRMPVLLINPMSGMMEWLTVV